MGLRRARGPDEEVTSKMTQFATTDSTATGLRVGDLVEVRSAEEIMATLDERGELENLPFMPEMLKFCGKRLTVHKVAHKLCDTISQSGLQKMENAVHLTGARCDGASHGGCEAACLSTGRKPGSRRWSLDAQIHLPVCVSTCR